MESSELIPLPPPAKNDYLLLKTKQNKKNRRKEEEEEERNEPFCFHLSLQTLIKHNKNLEDWDFLKKFIRVVFPIN